MPCNSDYLAATGIEKSLSRVACLLDELDGKPINPDYWAGYHPKIYCKNVSQLRHLVVELCEKLQKVDVRQYSLEMQMWWRDHQEADKARVQEKLEKAKHKAEVQEALKKLNPYERKLLGF